MRVSETERQRERERQKKKVAGGWRGRGEGRRQRTIKLHYLLFLLQGKKIILITLRRRPQFCANDF